MYNYNNNFERILNTKDEPPMGALVDFLKEYQNNPIAEHLPAMVTGKYIVCACLKETECRQVFLIQRKSDKKKFILKCFSPSSNENPVEEFELQKNLTHISIVPVVEFFQENSYSYIVREYIEGNTVTELVEMSREGHLDDEKMIDITKQLCHVLNYLHEQKPPIIHRDIKPDNIVITKDGRVKLIDFGISRRFDNEQGKDTVIMGTQYSAPPEQYGFQQTDARSDIYSLGVLMLYMATGSLDIHELDQFTISKPIRKCIKKCTRFSPKDRYDNVRSLKIHLQKEVMLSKHYKSLRIAGIILLIVIAFASGSVLTLRYNPTNALDRLPVEQTPLENGVTPIITEVLSEGLTDKANSETSESISGFLASDQEDKTNSNNRNADGYGSGSSDSEEVASGAMTSDDTQEYEFTSELIEEAVRGELNKSETEIITVGDLKKVKELYICGQQVYHNWDEHFVYGSAQYMMGTEYTDTAIYKINGYISSLEDLTHMPYINTLALYNQEIIDLSPLKEMKYLARLGLGVNKIEDISVLSGLSNLSYLDLSGTNISDDDLQTLVKLPHLVSLDIGATDITSIYDLKDMPLTYLSLFDTPLSNCDGLENMTSLDQLTITGVGQTITEKELMTIATLKKLRILKIMGGQPFDPSIFSDLPNLWLLDLCGKGSIDLDHFTSTGIEQLFIDCCEDLNLTGIENNQSLKLISLRNSVCYDYTPLLELKNLEEVTCSAEEAAEMKKQLGEVPFKITVTEDFP